MPDNLLEEGYENTMYAVILKQPAELDQLVPYLGKLVFVPAIVHIPSALSAKMKAIDPRGFKRWISRATAHNEKMGFNWRASKKYEATLES